MNGAADVEGGVGGERGALGGIEFPGGGDQAGKPDAVKVFEVQRRGEVNTHPIDRGLHQREVPLDAGGFGQLRLVSADGLGGFSWECGEHVAVFSWSDPFLEACGGETGRLRLDPAGKRGCWT